MAASAKAFDLTEEMLAVASTEAAALGVSPSLSDQDQLLGFFINYAKYPPLDATRAYFSGGRADAHAVLAAAQTVGALGGGKKILEFAAGFGRVTRHLKVLLPDNRFAASDIHDTACKLIQDGIGTRSFVSTYAPEDLQVEGEQDFIFVLSLFSHLPDRTFGPWLAALYNLLAPGGSLLFTTHGEAAIRHNREHFGLNFDEAKGFGYRPESDQQDISSSDYGTAVVTMPYVYDQIRRFTPDGQIKSFRAFQWFGLQDEWVIQRPGA